MAFCGVRTVQLVGLNPNTPFASMVAAGTLIYLSGSSILLENTRSREQRILWTNPHPTTPLLITHTITPHHQHFIAATIRHPLSPVTQLMVLPLAPPSPENPHPTGCLHSLPFLQAGEELQRMVFLEEGALVGGIAKKGGNCSLVVFRPGSSEALMVAGVGRARGVGAVGMGRKRWVGVVGEEGGGVWVRGWALGEMERKWVHEVRLEREETVVECAFQAYQEDCLLLVLTSTGFVVIYRISELQITYLTRADVRLHPSSIQHKLRRTVSIADCSQPRLPTLFKPAAGKVILGYTSPPTLAILSYSSLDPSCTRFTPFPATLSLPRAHFLLSIAVAPDNCTLSAVLRLASPSPCKTVVQLPVGVVEEREGQVVAVQVDLVGNLVGEGGRRESVEGSLSGSGGLGRVGCSAYCQFHNRLFVVVGWRLACYSLGHKQEVLLWEEALPEAAVGLAVHPFNFVVLLVYPDLVKLHIYSRHGLRPAHLVTNLCSPTQPAFSPLGDKLALATSSCLTFFDSYSLRKLAQYPLPSRQVTQAAQKAGSERWQLVQFVDNEEVMVVGSGGVSLVGRGRVAGVGSLEGLGMERVVGVGWDGSCGLGVLAGEEDVVVFGPATISSRSRCQVIARLKVAAASICLRSQLGVLWIGDRQGTLWMVQWKDCNQHETALSALHRYPLFDQPISALALSADAHLLFALSSSGTLATTLLQVADQQCLPRWIRDNLIRTSELPMRGMSHWLACGSQQQQLEREIIKLRGEEADLMGVRRSQTEQEEWVQIRKAELEELLAKEIKEYEVGIGLPQVLRNVVQVRDELKVSERRRERVKQEMVETHQNTLQELFQQTHLLQEQFEQARISCTAQKQRITAQLQAEKDNLIGELRLNGNHEHIDQIAESNHAQSQQQYHWTLEAAHQDHLIDLASLHLEMGDQLTHQTTSQQQNLAKMRNHNIRTQLLSGKLTEMSTQKQKMQCDLFLLQHEREQRGRILEGLAEENAESRQRYDRLVERVKQYEEQLINQRKLKEKCESAMEESSQAVGQLEEELARIEKKSLEINQQYLSQREALAYKQHTIEQLSAQVNQLKNTRKQKQDAALLRKTRLQQAVSSLARGLAVDAESTLQQLRENGNRNCEKEDQNIIMGREYVRQQELHDKLARDAGKWRQVKQSYMTGFTKNYHRLKEENLKLTYQYNDLLKVAQEYRTYTAHLHHQITTHTHQLPTRSKPSSSLLHRQPPNPRLRKPLICLSLHQSSDNFITQI